MTSIIKESEKEKICSKRKRANKDLDEVKKGRASAKTKKENKN